LTGKYFYRLKQIDYGGTFEYSKIVEVEIIPPVEFSLEQNYPNPFNPATKIKFTVPLDVRGEKQEVRLKVYDVLGNGIAILVNDEKSAGSYEVEFTVGQDSSPDIKSGIYFYSIQAENFTETKKMLIIE
jgi:hypothetical protein